MTRVLILSSWVAHGYVGLSAAAPALQILGHSVIQLPTTIQSNHPGWPEVAGSPVPVGQIEAMVDALQANGWLAECDAILTGYLPTAEHVMLATDLVRRLRAEDRPPRVIVDPVLGDWPGGLYVPEPVAIATRDQLLTFADLLTPNAFELGWLLGERIETLEQATSAGRRLSDRMPAIVLTSAPVPGQRIGVLLIERNRMQLWATPRLKDVPHGVGDVFSAFVAAGLSVSAAVGHLKALIEASLGAQHLQIVEAAPRWTSAGQLAPIPLPSHVGT